MKRNGTLNTYTNEASVNISISSINLLFTSISKSPKITSKIVLTIGMTSLTDDWLHTNNNVKHLPYLQI